MSLFGRPLSRMQTAALALVVVAIGFATTVAVGTAGSRSYGRPVVTILGAGEGLSILVTDGPARLLITSGDDSAAFGNALAKTRPLGRDRIDVLLLAGSTGDVTFLSRAVRTASGRHIEVIGNPDLLGAMGLPVDALLLTPRRFRLSDETQVTIETVEWDQSVQGPSFAWRATIERSATRVIVLSDGRVAGDFPDPGPVSALIVEGTAAVDALEQVETRVIVVSAAAVSGKDVRRNVAASAGDQTWIVRVFPGERTRFAFVEGGLQLPSNAIAVEATPQA